MEKKTDLSKYIVNVQGKDFITFPGLLAEAHSQGLTSIDTTLVNEDLNNPVMKATVKLGDRVFTGYGDANSNNVAKKVAGALIRMSETRAVARALRFACNIDMTALEELDSEEVSAPKPTATKSFNRTPAVQTVAKPNEAENIPTPVEVPATPVTPIQVTTTPAPTPSTTANRPSFGKRPTVVAKQEPKFP